MSCSSCQRRSALIAAVAPAIARLSLGHQALLFLLALPDEQLLRAVKVEDPGGFLRSLQLPAPTDSVPTALCRHDAGYPQALAQLPCAPAVLYATCTPKRLRELLSSPKNPKVGIVGSRGLTSYTEHATFALAWDLARAGVTIVGGVNEGPEGIAHHGAVAAGGHTIAVTARSPQLSQLARHDGLQQRILAQGAGVSEFPPGFIELQRWCLNAAQRITAALADILVVIEAGGFSCATLTTHIATELGRDITVVPGRVNDPGGPRMFRLLRDGAHPVWSAEDVLAVMYNRGGEGCVVSKR